MNRRDQHLIATEILDSLRETIMANIDRVPNEWDGIELRQWIADTALDRYAHKMDRTRAKAYHNTRIVENL